MPQSKRTLSLAVVTALVLGTFLAISAVWQYRLIDVAVNAERDQQQRVMQSSVDRFAVDSERELSRAFNFFQVERQEESAPSKALGAARSNWAEEAGSKNIVKQLYLLRQAWSEQQTLHRIEDDGELSAPIDWPDSLLAVRDYLAKPASRRWARWFPVGLADPTAAIGPLVRTGRFIPNIAPSDVAIHRRHLLIVVFDRQVIRDQVLTRLANENLVSELFPFEYRVVDRTTQETLLESAAVPKDGTAPAVEESFFRSGFYLGFRTPGRGPTRPPDDPDAPWNDKELAARSWHVSMFHRDGSLEAVAHARRVKESAVSLSIIAVLGLTSLWGIWFARRLRNLAQQRMEFVATVTHELNTPLTSIHAAAQNLSDGVVAGPNEVRAYGLLIQEDSHRLQRMVEQVLTYASLTSAPLMSDLQSVSVAELVDEVVADTKSFWTREEMQVDIAPCDGLPDVRTHREVVTRIVRNLLSNAVRHARSGRWIGIRARLERNSHDRHEWVVITVSDRGPGIADSDRPHIFEPFYRGRAAADHSTPGTGLGLCISQQLAAKIGGKLTLDANTPTGASFSLWLPVNR
ncbi:MAG: HAMP domain-containing sensor histidine kinase [Acidobacteriota bacterium]